MAALQDKQGSRCVVAVFAKTALLSALESEAYNRWRRVGIGQVITRSGPGRVRSS